MKTRLPNSLFHLEGNFRTTGLYAVLDRGINILVTPTDSCSVLNLNLLVWEVSLLIGTDIIFIRMGSVFSVRARHYIY